MFNVYSQGPDEAEEGLLAARQRKKRGKRYNLGSERSGKHLKYITQPWFQDDLGVVVLKFQANRVDGKGLQVSYSLDTSANSRAVFNESTLRLEDFNGSNGGPSTSRALSMVGKSQGETVRGRSLILQAPRKNRVTALS